MLTTAEAWSQREDVPDSAAVAPQGRHQPGVDKRRLTAPRTTHDHHERMLAHHPHQLADIKRLTLRVKLPPEMMLLPQPDHLPKRAVFDMGKRSFC
jgi:hypothetical protein